MPLKLDSFPWGKWFSKYHNTWLGGQDKYSKLRLRATRYSLRALKTLVHKSEFFLHCGVFEIERGDREHEFSDFQRSGKIVAVASMASVVSKAWMIWKTWSCTHYQDYLQRWVKLLDQIFKKCVTLTCTIATTIVLRSCFSVLISNAK